MKPAALMTALEDTALLIARLDTRLSASPLAEAWQVRACFLAAETLAAIDGTPTRSADIVGLISDTPLPSPANYRPATVGFGHWRRCLARVELSDLASRLVGRTLTARAQAAEKQADRDFEKTLPAAARRGHAATDEIDRYAQQVSDRALRILREQDDGALGSRFRQLALALQAAIRIDPDPDFFKRIYWVRREFEAQTRARAAEANGPHPSPADPVEQAEDFLTSVAWEKQPHLGACFAVVPDRLQDVGITTSRLSCLTGATRRLGFEGRLDDRAFRGFLRQLAQEARAGLALLDSLEQVAAQFANSSKTRFDARSRLPEILYAFLLYPALDTVWLQTTLDLEERVVQKFVKRLAQMGLITHWSQRRPRGEGVRAVRVWTAARFADDFTLALRRQAADARPGRGMTISPAEMLERHRDVDIRVPMSVVFARFETEMVDIDRAFGRLFGSRQSKKRTPQMPVQRDLVPLATL